MSENTFKVGDKVRVIDAGLLLVVGETHTVTGLSRFFDGGHAVLLGHEYDGVEGWRIDRFVLANPAPPADLCAACGAAAVLRDELGNEFAVHYGQQWRLCQACWQNPSKLNNAAIYERHIKPKEQQKAEAATPSKFNDAAVNRLLDHANAEIRKAIFGQAVSVRKPNPNPERTGPYGGSDTTHEAMIATRQRAEDEMSGRRAALVANITAEHTKASDLSGLLHPLGHWSTKRDGRRKR